jgi:hypothetical protein
MSTFKHVGAAVIAAVFAIAITAETADARRGGGGGGGGARAGGFGGGGGGVRGGGGIQVGGAGAIRGGNFGNRAHVSHPIVRPGPGNGGWVNRPGGPGWGYRPGYRPGYGWGVAAAGVAIGAGVAYSNSYCDGYWVEGYCQPYNTGTYDNGYTTYETPYQSYEQPYQQTYEEPYPQTYRQPYTATTATQVDLVAIAACAKRFRSYDIASQTYLLKNGERVSCP